MEITGKPDTGKTLLLKTKAMELLNAQTKKPKKNMSTCTHMQTKFFLWEGLVELLL